MATARRKIAAISEMPKSAAKNSLQNQAIMFIGSFGDCHEQRSASEPLQRDRQARRAVGPARNLPRENTQPSVGFLA
jgi:hypothetical protein